MSELFTRLWRTSFRNFWKSLRVLQMEEQGVSRHSRASNGDLVWFLSKKGQEIFRQQKALEDRTLAQRRLAIKQDLNC